MEYIDKKLYAKLPKYAKISSQGAEVDLLFRTKTSDGYHYTIIYTDGETFEEYGYQDFLYCIKKRINT